jgi:oligoribonuclease NrnB/cAMP/cGMP phosphodiesterase (DHH superfamily)
MIHDFDIIVYHHNCPDGLCGLWCAEKYNTKPFTKIGTPAGKDPVGNFIDKDIIFIDVCPSIQFIKENAFTAKKITILDHHKSAYDSYLQNKEELDKFMNVHYHFDMKKSGCQIAWSYFFGENKSPWFLDYIADQDLWTWSLQFSKEINCAIDFDKLDKLNELDNYNAEQIINLINEGKTILNVKQKIMQDQLLESVEGKMTFNGNTYNIQLGTIPFDMRSAFGNLLATKPLKNGLQPDFGVVWMYKPSENRWIISLRGTDISPDLSVIATYFNGGGHAKACAFKLSYNPFNNIFIIS